MIENQNLINKKLPISYRNKTYSVRFIKNWFEKNKIPVQTLNNQSANNVDFQSNNIIDQIKVLLDNVNFYKLHYMQGKEVKKINKFFNNYFNYFHFSFLQFLKIWIINVK